MVGDRNAKQSIVEELIGTSAQILVVEDESLVADAIALALQDEGYRVQVANSGYAALAILTLNELPINESQPSLGDFNLILLDLMLPDIGGLDICRLIRNAKSDVPILILSAKSSETDRVVGLEVGADDYLAKPFGMRELIARVRALLRRSRTYAPAPENEVQQLVFRELRLYLDEYRAFLGERELVLARKEFQLLVLFMRSPKQVFSREQLLAKIWGPEYSAESKTIDVHIRWLREKIENDPSQPEYIVTVRGFGYRLG
jgi:two-component system, OmpR family, phosphate regulon response regulator PhoB